MVERRWKPRRKQHLAISHKMDQSLGARRPKANLSWSAAYVRMSEAAAKGTFGAPPPPVDGAPPPPVDTYVELLRRLSMELLRRISKPKTKTPIADG